MTTVLDEIAKLEAQLADTRATAIKELRVRKAELAAELKKVDQKITALGGSGKAKSRAKRKQDPNKKCPVCGEVGHDGRKHAGDSKKVKK